MQRRDFLQSIGAIGAIASTKLTSRANEQPSSPAAKALEVKQLETDRFQLVFQPTAPRPLRVLQITDTHFGNQDLVHKALDRRTFDSITWLVAEQTPDFIVHNGDFINND